MTNGLQRRICAVRYGQANVVRLSALHLALRGELDGVAILAQYVVGRVVDVIGTELVPRG